MANYEVTGSFFIFQAGEVAAGGGNLMSSIFYRTYGQACYIPITLWDAEGVDLKKDAICASGDIIVRDDQGTEYTFGTDFTDAGTGYLLYVAANELQVKIKNFWIEDQTSPKAFSSIDFRIETCGHANAQHPGINLLG